MTQMTIADAKAGGILVFLVAVSGVTVRRLSEDTVSVPSLAAGLLAIALSIAGSVFAFSVIWPRLTGHGPVGNVFSWVSVASRTPDEQIRLLNDAPERQLIDNIGEAMVDIAVIVREKYSDVQRALIALIPATALHLLNWLLT
jgi:hypothetical protein